MQLLSCFGSRNPIVLHTANSIMGRAGGQTPTSLQVQKTSLKVKKDESKKGPKGDFLGKHLLKYIMEDLTFSSSYAYSKLAR